MPILNRSKSQKSTTPLSHMNKAIQTQHDCANRLRLLDILDRITQLSLANENMDDVLRGVLDLVLETFQADRAWFVYPCDPNAISWSVPIERTRPEWPGIFATGVSMPMDDDIAGLFTEHLGAQEAIQYCPDSSHIVPQKIAERFSVKSQVIVTLRPNIGSTWLFGFHHCKVLKVHNDDELRLFARIAHRISDTLKVLISSRQLRESAAEIQDLYDNAPCGYHSLDEDGIIRQINNTELGWLGYRREDVINKMKWSDFIAACCVQSYQANLACLVRTGSIEDVEYVLVRKDGTQFHGLLSATAVVDVKRRFVMSRATLTNIDSLKKAERHLQELTAHLHDVLEEEKVNISREIHDELGGTMTAIKLETHWLKTELSEIKNSSAMLDRVEAMSRLIDQASVSMRNIVTGLRPTMLDDLGLLAALEWKASQFQQRTGIVCRVNCIGNKGNLDKQRSISLFRIAQEALTNVVKHSGASKVDIEYLHSDDEILLSVIDNGSGLSLDESAATTCCGILGMRERANRHGGKIGFDTPTGGGFIVTVVFPVV